MLTWVEIDKRALAHNIAAFRQQIGSETLLMPVIKGNAYGHGFLEVARLLTKNKEVDRLCVASLNEALDLIKAKILKKPILILSFYDLDKEQVGLAIHNNVSFALYTHEQAVFLNTVATKLHKKVNVHLKIDTGTSRVGILPDEALSFVKKLQKYPSLVIAGVWTHFAASESDALFTKKQLQSFDGVQQTIQKFVPPNVVWHTSCTAATLLHQPAKKHAVRVGIGLYGLYPSTAARRHIALKPVLRWFTKLIQVKNVPTGTSIGYDATYRTKRPTRLGVLPVGYFDGFDRRFSNNGFVLVQGKKCRILGRICMNLTMVDVTDLPRKPKAGDRVTLIGKDKQESITADSLARLATTIHYEIVDRINPQLPRIVI